MTDTIETVHIEAVAEANEAPKRGRPPKAVQPAAPEGYVTVRVLKAGDGKVAKGTRAEGKPLYYAKGDEFQISADIATALEDRGLVEVQ
jgi:hypothetical protein